MIILTSIEVTRPKVPVKINHSESVEQNIGGFKNSWKVTPRPVVQV